MQRVAIYARYSTDKQDARSIDDQVRRCRGLAQERGYEVVDEYADGAVSGTHTDREHLQRLLTDANARRFDIVLVDDLSRLSRDLGDVWNLVFTRLAFPGVAVVDVTTKIASTDPSARMVFGTMGLVSDTFVQMIRTETHRGLEGRALGGFATGGKTYGYANALEPNPPDPLHPRKIRVIKEDEAAIVRRIFELAADGVPTKRIAAILNQEGISAPHDGGRGNKVSRGWGSTTVRYMLRNENYVGRWVWNRNKFSRIPGTNSYKNIPRPEKEHVRKEIPETRIIDQELWDRAHRALGPKRTAQNATLGTGSKPGSLLSGLVKCGVCGGAISVRGRRYKKGVAYTSLGCGIHQSRGPSVCSNNRTVSSRKLTEVVVSALRDLLTKDGLTEKVSEGFKRRNQSPTKSRDLEKQVTATESKIRNLTDVLSHGYLASIAERLKEEEMRLLELRAQLSASKGSEAPKVVAHPRVIEAFIVDLLRNLEVDQDRARAILQRCMPALLLTPIGGGKFRVTGGFDLDATLQPEVSGPSSRQGSQNRSENKLRVCGPSSRRDRD